LLASDIKTESYHCLSVFGNQNFGPELAILADLSQSMRANVDVIGTMNKMSMTNPACSLLYRVLASSLLFTKRLSVPVCNDSHVRQLFCHVCIVYRSAGVAYTRKSFGVVKYFKDKVNQEVFI
jgi:hypothetical protein